MVKFEGLKEEQLKSGAISIRAITQTKVELETRLQIEEEGAGTTAINDNNTAPLLNATPGTEDGKRKVKDKLGKKELAIKYRTL